MTEAPKKRRAIQVLLVEDSAADAELMREALQDKDYTIILHVAHDGEEALNFLYQRGDLARMPRPDLVLLDLNMPRKNGHEVLQHIKQDDALKTIPVIILTSSEAEHEIRASYEMHANAYIVKPSSLDQLLHVTALIKSFWLVLSELPQAGEQHAPHLHLLRSNS